MCSGGRENFAATNPVILSGSEGDMPTSSSSQGRGGYQVPISSMLSQCALAEANASHGLWKEYSALPAEYRNHYSLSNLGFQRNLCRDLPARVHRSVGNPPLTNYGLTYSCAVAVE